MVLAASPAGMERTKRGWERMNSWHQIKNGQSRLESTEDAEERWQQRGSIVWIGRRILGSSALSIHQKGGSDHAGRSVDRGTSSLLHPAKGGFQDQAQRERTNKFLNIKTRGTRLLNEALDLLDQGIKTIRHRRKAHQGWGGNNKKSSCWEDKYFRGECFTM